MKVLVTGGAGYVGGVSVDAILAAGHQVVVLDDLSTGHAAIANPAARLVTGSYGDEAATRSLLEAEGVDAILHCAARSLVGESVLDPAKYYRDNVAGGVALLEAARGAGVRRVVFSSTAAVYGTPDSTPIAEDAALRPINTYGETKRTFEGALHWYGVAYGFRSVILRYFNVAGATERLGEVHRPETHLVPNVLLAAAGGPALTLFGHDYPTPDGTAIRDYIHVSDLADAHVAALEATAPDDPRTGSDDDAASATPVICNLGTSHGYSVREILQAAEAVVGRPIPHTVGPRRAGDPPVLVASNGRAREMLGWAPRHSSLEEMLGSAWAWRLAHPDGYGD
jgi:UDP-glucose 4-epimerase